MAAKHSSPNNQKGDNDPDNNSGGATAQNGGGELSPEGNDFRVNFFEVGGGGIALIVGIMLDVAGFHKAGLVFDSIALACAIGLLDHYIREKTKFKHRRKLFWILMGLNFGLIAFLFWVEISPSKNEFVPSLPTNPITPKLNSYFLLTLNTSESPNCNLELTNDFLFFPPGKGNFLSLDSGFVVIPMQENHSNITLQIVVKNNSPTKVAGAQIVLWIPKSSHWVLDSRWLPIQSDRDDRIGFVNQLLSAFLLNGDGEQIPNITFDPITPIPSTIHTAAEVKEHLLPLIFEIKGDSTPTTFVGFWMLPVPSTMATNPIVILGNRIWEHNEANLLLLKLP